MAPMTQNLDVGGVISRVFALYSKHLAVLLGVGAIIFIPLGIIEGVLTHSDSLIIRLLGSVVGLIGTYLFVGAVVRLVQDLQDGSLDASVGGLISSISPVLVTLIIVGFLAGLATGIGFILCIVPGLFLLTIWAVVSPVVVVENAGVGQAFTRSRELVKGNGWQVFGVLVLFFVIEAVAGFVLVAILIALSDTIILAIIAAILARLLLSPLQALASSVIYFDLIAIKQGAAAAPIADPPLPPPPPPPAPAV
jgi:hypothetical protein